MVLHILSFKTIDDRLTFVTLHAALANAHVQKPAANRTRANKNLRFTKWYVGERPEGSVYSCTKEYKVNTKRSPRELFHPI